MATANCVTFGEVNHRMSVNHNAEIAQAMYDFAVALFPICRSITGEGTRRTLRMIREKLPGLVIHEAPSGTKCFDWTVPDEWNIDDAFVMDEDGRKVVDFQRHNLHVVSYSVPVDTTVSLEELQEHLHSSPAQPTAIPFLTSYYVRRWGFCLAHAEREKLRPGNYRVKIDSSLKPGVLNYGELILPGDEEKEILLSTYVCHPSMANNEVSGPVVTTALAEWLSWPTGAAVHVPDCLCAGDDRFHRVPEPKSCRNEEKYRRRIRRHLCGRRSRYSFLPSRRGNTLADRVATHVLRHHAPDCAYYSFLDRGSDERQYCSVGVDLPVVSVMRRQIRVYRTTTPRSTISR